MNDLWQPTSSCDVNCLNDDEPFTAVGRLRSASRFAAAAGVMLVAVVLTPVLPLLPAGSRARPVRWCARGVLRALGIRVSVRGRIPSWRPAAGRGAAGSACGGTLVVANHISWLDIVVLLAAGRTRLVAKCEVGEWPVVGRIARYAGTIFVDRARPRALPAAVADVRSALEAGEVVVVFPEGTTSCGRSIGRFRPAFFQAAVEAGAAIVPVTLRFGLAGAGRTAAAAFIGDETLLDSLRRIMRLPRLDIRLVCGSIIHPASGATRRSLARVAAMAVGASGPAADRGTRRQAPVAVPPVAVPPVAPIPLRTEVADEGAAGPLALRRAA
ncbi:lysophospholipid acyltransferase family protein [Rugosimonospora acidiphila]|uniref:lysophospholipid acyltransferase family protein n=1 Tax=Rugosimonospora acidiphila TaxID=556531 RepID=UPI0031E6C5E0